MVFRSVQERKVNMAKSLCSVASMKPYARCALRKLKTVTHSLIYKTTSIEHASVHSLFIMMARSAHGIKPNDSVHFYFQQLTKVSSNRASPDAEYFEKIQNQKLTKVSNGKRHLCIAIFCIVNQLSKPDGKQLFSASVPTFY